MQSLLLLALYVVYVAVIIGQEAMRKRDEYRSTARKEPPYRYVPVISDMNDVCSVIP